MSAEAISTLRLEGPCDHGHFDRGFMLDTAQAFLDDMAPITDSVPRAVIAFGEDGVTVYGELEGMPWGEFARAALDLCKAREDVYGIAVVRPHGAGGLIYTSHFEDGAGTVEDGFFLPELRSYTFVPAAEVN